MATRLVNVDRDTPLLLPPDLREWVPAGHMVHFIIIDAVEVFDVSSASLNTRGTGILREFDGGSRYLRDFPPADLAVAPPPLGPL